MSAGYLLASAAIHCQWEPSVIAQHPLWDAERGIEPQWCNGEELKKVKLHLNMMWHISMAARKNQETSTWSQRKQKQRLFSSKEKKGGGGVGGEQSFFTPSVSLYCMQNRVYGRGSDLATDSQEGPWTTWIGLVQYVYAWSSSAQSIKLATDLQSRCSSRKVWTGRFGVTASLNPTAESLTGTHSFDSIWWSEILWYVNVHNETQLICVR